jgi:hypothetical protein
MVEDEGASHQISIIIKAIRTPINQSMISNSHFGTVTHKLLGFSVLQPQWVDGNESK